MTNATTSSSQPTTSSPAWHTLPAADILQRLGVDPARGLDSGQVQRRQQQYGPNELEERGGKGPWRIFLEQFTETMVVVLIIAAIVSGVIGDLKDALAILIIVILNGLLGFSQEYRAEQALAALKKMAAPQVKVRRGGAVQQVEAPELAPGDIILLETGDSVPADARLVEAANLRVQEASLTGESTAVDKLAGAEAAADAPLGDRHNMVFMGTAVTLGRATAVVVETGMSTQLGHIAHMLQTVDSGPTPLQRRMGQLGKVLAAVAGVIVVIVFVLGLLRGADPGEMFLTGVALAVAAIPEGLPAVITIALALGAQRMLRRKALIRKLPAVETLGSVTVICSDKTGTLTENRMTVTILDVAEQRVAMDQVLRHDHPVLQASDARIEPTTAALAMILAGGALCNDAIIQADQETAGDFSTVGDPTEAALVVAAARYGLWKQELEENFPRIAEAPFTSERKLMTTIHQVSLDGRSMVVNPYMRQVLKAEQTPYIAITKGAVDQLLEISDRVWVEDRFLPLDEEWRRRVHEANAQLARDGLRVLGVAFRPLHDPPPEGKAGEAEQSLAIAGLFGMIDPPRPEVEAAVQTAKTAGIRPVMITGDHPLTALRIAQDLGIANGDVALTGRQLSAMSDRALEEVVGDVSVYARVSPEHKLRIVQALQRQGHIVAMTGDGVNDAPALRQAEIGVAMGVTGTDVSKEAADMVLLDDNFATIVAAVEEGRTIYDNVRKFIRYTLTSNAGEILVMLLAPFLGMPLPLTALQILWINLVTDGLPGLALSLEKPERNAMRRPPYPPDESVLARGMGPSIVWVGLLMGLVSLAVGYWGLAGGNAAWTTMVFTTLTLSQMGNALAVRSNRDSLFSLGLFSNRLMLGAVLLTFFLQLAITYVEPLQAIFNTQALGPLELGISLAASTIVFWAVEGEKWRRRP